MLCPVCRFDNFEGEDSCINCGADLSTSDIPQSLGAWHDTVLGDRLVELGVGAPTIVGPDLPVGDAIRRMHAAGSDCLLVCSGNRIVGIFTDRDALVKVAGQRPGSVAVSTFMTPDPVVLRRDDTLAIAIHKMAVGGFRHIPIVDGDTPLGVVAAADVFRHLVSSLG